LWPTSFSPDGRRLAFFENALDTRQDIWTLPLDTSDADHPKTGKPEVFLRTPASEIDGAFSPDGRWMAYASDESGKLEVFVRPFPGPGGKCRISTDGGRLPNWSRDGREVFYPGSDGRIMVTDYVTKGDTFSAGKPRVWSDRLILLSTFLSRNMDLAPDGKRFAVFPRSETSAKVKGSVHVTVLLNFFDELRRRAR
jgi:Tol biopolymer transport system component